MTPAHVVVVPSTLLLLPTYAGHDDPIAELRAAVRAAVGWLVSHHGTDIAVLAAGARPDNLARGVTEPSGGRIGAHLLADAGFQGRVGASPGVLVVANGTACRSEKAPGHLDERSFELDETIDKALRAGDPAPLRDLDVTLGDELWAHDLPAFRELGRSVGSFVSEVDYAGDPFGVQYWVVRWTCNS